MALIILAGGASSRMGGGNKAFLQLGPETMLERMVSRLSDLFSEIIVVAQNGNVLQREKIRVVSDIYPGFGPLSGLHAGLCASSDTYNLVLACDLPLIRAQVVKLLLSRADELQMQLQTCAKMANYMQNATIDAIVPAVNGEIEPLVAIYNQSVLPVVENFIQTGKYKLRDIFRELQVDYVPEEAIRACDPRLESFLNVNTPEDYAQVVEILTRRGEV